MGRMTSLLDATPDPLLTLEPARQATVREVFGIDSDMTVPVFADRDSRRIVGILSEAHAIKRYSDEVSRRNRDLTGE